MGKRASCYSKGLFLLFALLIMLPGCVKPIPTEHLIPDNLSNEYLISSGPLYQAIVVNTVEGCNKTDPMLYAEIENPELKEAVIRSLAGNNYLALNNKNGDYTLNVFLVDVDRPKPGTSLTLTVTTFVKYTVIKNKNNEVIYDEIIDATDTKTVSDAFAGMKRIRIAQEDSMKKNISKFIEKLFLLNKKL